MSIQTLPAQFEQHNLDIIIIGNERWARGSQVGLALGFAFSQQSMNKLHSRNKHEFGVDDTMVVELPTAGGAQLTRLYSAKGIAKVAMFANTDKAAAFRDWAAQMLTTPKPERETLNLKHPVDLRDELIATQRELINMQLIMLGRQNKEKRRLQPWTPEDDDNLIRLTREQGPERNWRTIAEAMGRTVMAVSSRGHILRVKGLVQ